MFLMNSGVYLHGVRLDILLFHHHDSGYIKGLMIGSSLGTNRFLRLVNCCICSTSTMANLLGDLEPPTISLIWSHWWILFQSVIIPSCSWPSHTGSNRKKGKFETPILTITTNATGLNIWTCLEIGLHFDTLPTGLLVMEGGLLGVEVELTIACLLYSVDCRFISKGWYSSTGICNYWVFPPFARLIDIASVKQTTYLF